MAESAPPLQSLLQLPKAKPKPPSSKFSQICLRSHPSAGRATRARRPLPSTVEVNSDGVGQLAPSPPASTSASGVPPLINRRPQHPTGREASSRRLSSAGSALGPSVNLPPLSQPDDEQSVHLQVSDISRTPGARRNAAADHPFAYVDESAADLISGRLPLSIRDESSVHLQDRQFSRSPGVRRYAAASAAGAVPSSSASGAAVSAAAGADGAPVTLSAQQSVAAFNPVAADNSKSAPGSIGATAGLLASGDPSADQPVAELAYQSAAPPMPSVRGMSQGKKPSYSSIVRAPHASFIKSHSKSVEAFGALPDIVSASRISAFDGEPLVQFSLEELKEAESVFVDAVIIKFLSGRPTWEVCYTTICSWGLQQDFIMGPLDSRSILIRFRNPNDMLVVLAREANYINGFPYRAYRWNRQYNVKEEAALVPVWVSFPQLPIPFFIPSLLKSISNSIGNFLCFDRSTSLMTRASSARVCIEVDLRSKLPDNVWIKADGTFRQPIVYEKLPSFCNLCKIQGHNRELCKRTVMHNGEAATLQTPLNSDLQTGPITTHAQDEYLNASEPNPLVNGSVPEAALETDNLVAHVHGYAAQSPYSLSHEPLSRPDLPAGLDTVAYHGQASSSAAQKQTPAAHPQLQRHTPSAGFDSGDKRGRISALPHPSALPKLARADQSIVEPSNSQNSSEPNILKGKTTSYPSSDLSFGPWNVCTTDFLNQRPSPFPMDMMQISDYTSTPGVCGYAAAEYPSDLIRPGNAEFNPNRSLSPAQLQGHELDEYSAQVSDTPPAAHQQASAPISVIQLCDSDQSGQFSEVLHVCKTDVSHQRSPPPSSDPHHAVLAAEQAAVFPCPPGVRQNVNMNTKSSIIPPSVLDGAAVIISVPPTSPSPPVSHQNRCFVNDNQHSKPKQPAVSPSAVLELDEAPAVHLYPQRNRQPPLDLIQAADLLCDPGVRRYAEATSDTEPCCDAAASLSPDQVAAMKRLKCKIRDGALMSIGDPSYFQDLRENSSDDEDFSGSVASYDSDDGRFALGHQSADDRSMGNPKAKFTPSGIKVNKRHPNIPLNVRLRARKSSYPSTP